MRVALVEPPATDPRSPHLAMASLHAALALDGVEVLVVDGGAEALAWLLRRDRVETAWSTLDRSVRDRSSGAGSRPGDEQARSYLHRLGPLLVDGIDDALAVLRSPVRFYDAADHDEAREVMSRVLDLHRAVDGRHDYGIAPIRYSVAGIDPGRLDDLDAATADPGDGPLAGFHRDLADRLDRWAPHIVAVSILNHQQIIPGLTLARLLRRRGHLVVIGGTVFAKFGEQLRSRPRFFELFCDAVCIAEGETALRALAAEAASAGAEGRPVAFAGIPNLLWLDRSSGTVGAGPVHSEDVASLPTPCFDGFDLGRYLVPEPVLPILTGKGCYFNRCRFCDIPFINRIAPRPYRRRRPEQVAGDIAALWHRHGARHVVVTDEALAPRFLLQITEALADHPGVEPRLVGYARFEAGFTSDVCQRLHSGGVRRLFFGLESGSQRMLDHMDKGVQVGTAHDVPRNCAGAGIGFHLFSMVGLPEETEADAGATLSFFLDEAERIDHPRNSIDLHRFNLDLRTDYFEHAERYGIEVDHEALDLIDFPLDAPAWTPTRGLAHDDAGRLVEAHGAVLRDRFRRSRAFPSHVYPSFEEYSVLYADRFDPAGDWSLRFALPGDDDPTVCTLTWCRNLAVTQIDNGALLSAPTGQRALSTAAAALLLPAPPPAPACDLLDGLLTRLGTTSDPGPGGRFRVELRAIIDDLLALGMLRLRVPVPGGAP